MWYRDGCEMGEDWVGMWYRAGCQMEEDGVCGIGLDVKCLLYYYYASTLRTSCLISQPSFHGCVVFIVRSDKPLQPAIYLFPGILNCCYYIIFVSIIESIVQFVLRPPVLPDVFWL